jgi:hypothetical protein
MDFYQRLVLARGRINQKVRMMLTRVICHTSNGRVALFCCPLSTGEPQPKETSDIGVLETKKREGLCFAGLCWVVLPACRMSC